MFVQILTDDPAVIEYAVRDHLDSINGSRGIVESKNGIFCYRIEAVSSETMAPQIGASLHT